jgi:hypothetical protein
MNRWPSPATEGEIVMSKPDGNTKPVILAEGLVRVPQLLGCRRQAIIPMHDRVKGVGE